MNKTIVFTQLRGPSMWQYKIAKELKKRKYQTVIFLILKIKEYDLKTCKKAFSEIYTLNLENLNPISVLKAFFSNMFVFIYFLWKLLTIEPYVSISEGAAHYVAALFIMFFKRKCKRIYFPYDMNFARLKNPEKFIPKHELIGERYAFKHCDGLMYKSGEGELKFLPKEFDVFSKPNLAFPCYVLSEWNQKYNKKKKLSSKDKEIHLAFVGQMSVKSIIGDPIKNVFKEIVSQRMHIHVYTFRTELPENQLKEIAPTKELKKFFHLHDYVLPNKLSEELSKYDFGLFPVDYSQYAKPGVEKFASANKVASYFEAGLPVITKKTVEIYAKHIRKHKIGILVNEKYSDIRKLIEKSNYQKIVENVCKFREEYSVSNHIDELIKFIDSLTKVSKSK